MRSILTMFITGVFAGFTFASDLNRTPLRTWVDNTGTYRIKATLVNTDPQTQSVQLRLETGELVNLPVRRLSAADRNFLNTASSATTAGRPVNIAGILWYNDLRDARQAAAAGTAPRDDKPIMCFRALGDLSGFM